MPQQHYDNLDLTHWHDLPNDLLEAGVVPSSTPLLKDNIQTLEAHSSPTSFTGSATTFLIPHLDTTNGSKDHMWVAKQVGSSKCQLVANILHDQRKATGKWPKIALFSEESLTDIMALERAQETCEEKNARIHMHSVHSYPFLPFLSSDVEDEGEDENLDPDEDEDEDEGQGQDIETTTYDSQDECLSNRGSPAPQPEVTPFRTVASVPYSRAEKMNETSLNEDGANDDQEFEDSSYQPFQRRSLSTSPIPQLLSPGGSSSSQTPSPPTTPRNAPLTRAKARVAQANRYSPDLSLRQLKSNSGTDSLSRASSISFASMTSSLPSTPITSPRLRNAATKSISTRRKPYSIKPSARKRKSKTGSEEIPGCTKFIDQETGDLMYRCTSSECTTETPKKHADMTRHLNTRKHGGKSEVLCDAAKYEFGCGALLSRTYCLRRHIEKKHPQWLTEYDLLLK